MRDFLHAVLSYLADNGLGIIQEDLFGLTLPTKPYDCIVVTQPGGESKPGDPTKRHKVQITIRCTNPELGMIKANSVFNLLNNQWNILTAFPGRFVATSELGAFSKDNNNHTIFPLSFIFYTIKSV